MVALFKTSEDAKIDAIRVIVPGEQLADELWAQIDVPMIDRSQVYDIATGLNDADIYRITHPVTRVR